jgi:outer membrane protein assembly factor BamB
MSLSRRKRRKITTIIAIVLALLVAGAPLLFFWPSSEEIVIDEGSWTMPGGGPAHLSYLPFAPSGPLQERWDTRLESTLAGPAAVAGERAYACCENGFLYCLDLASGRPLWRYDATSGITSMPALSETGILLGTMDGKVLCVSPEGELNWEVEVGGAVSSTPIPGEGRVYFGSNDHNLYCVREADGSTLWSFEAEGPVEVSPCLYEGQVFGVSLEGELFALDARDGRLIWTYRTTGIPAAFPCAEEGKVFLASEFELHCADAQSGKVLWKYDIGPTVISNLAIRGNQLVVVRGSGSGMESSAVSLDTRTGDVLWESAAGSAAGRTGLFASNEAVYLGITDSLLALAVESGIPSMEKELAGIIPETLTVTRSCILVGSDSRKVYCFEE